MRTFHLDPDVTRQLARDVENGSHFSNPSPPPLPASASVEDFYSALAAAMSNVHQRRSTLSDDLRHVAEVGFATVRTAQLADATSASQFNTQGV
ncbi:MAG: transducer protein Htr23 [Corynebacterium sp.]|nr:transducer protein Htr23 [Corynebacterium sp.]